MLSCLLLALCLSQTTEAPSEPLPHRWLEARASMPEEMHTGFDFLLKYMPQDDRENLDAELLVENVTFAYHAWQMAPWGDQISEEVFLNQILPYASINERRDRWRKDFYERFQPLVAEAESPAEAAAILNQTIFPQLGVIYSTKRPKADQSPYESIEAGMASCTGLSVLLIDACRSVGVPARFVGTPLWADGSGNHSWVEIWDDGWHFTGAAEPTGMELNQAWFTERAGLAIATDKERAIYAVSYLPTSTELPMVWQPDADTVYAQNVTHRYVQQKPLAEGMVRLRVRARLGNGSRISVPVRMEALHRPSTEEGKTRDDSFDANDHLTLTLPKHSMVRLVASYNNQKQVLRFEAPQDGTLLELRFGEKISSREVSPKELLWETYAAQIRLERAQEMEQRTLVSGDLNFRFSYKTFGEQPRSGHSLYISMHGGGGAPTEVNDQQWENQKGLYEPREGIYLAPRAPTDTWNLWHQSHVDDFLDRLITNMVVFEGVNPNKVYIMGYSAGGDGVYQLAPRMADRWAGAAMMAGHPNDAKPDSLFNLPFTLHMGEEDAAYDRNVVAQQWIELLDELEAEYPLGYPHWGKIHEGKGHWMDREDAAAAPWMANFERNANPERIIWLQDDVTHDRFYWLKTEQPKARSRIVVSHDGNLFRIESDEGLQEMTLRMDETMIDFSQDVVVMRGEIELFRGLLTPNLDTLRTTLRERGDPAAMWSAEVTVSWED